MIWKGLSTIIRKVSHVYSDEEDERIATTILEMVNLNKIKINELCEWIEHEEIVGDTFLTKTIFRTNWKNFLRSLYFRVKDKMLDKEIENLVALEEKFLIQLIWLPRVAFVNLMGRFCYSSTLMRVPYDHHLEPIDEKLVKLIAERIHLSKGTNGYSTKEQFDRWCEEYSVDRNVISSVFAALNNPRRSPRHPASPRRTNRG